MNKNAGSCSITPQAERAVQKVIIVAEIGVWPRADCPGRPEEDDGTMLWQARPRIRGGFSPARSFSAPSSHWHLPHRTSTPAAATWPTSPGLRADSAPGSRSGGIRVPRRSRGSGPASSARGRATPPPAACSGSSWRSRSCVSLLCSS